MHLDYVAHIAIPQPVFSLSIAHLGGTLLTAPNTREAGVVPVSISGHGSVDVRFPSLPLLPGTFDVSVAVHDFSLAHCYDSRQHVAQFDVQRGQPAEADGLVTLSPTWQLSSVTEVVP